MTIINSTTAIREQGHSYHSGCAAFQYYSGMAEILKGVCSRERIITVAFIERLNILAHNTIWQ